MSAAEAKSPQTAREWAIFYASLGWSVVPVRTGEKMPSVPWAKFQTLPADLGTINGWFDAAPSIGLGLVQGRNAGTIVLDFDGELGHATLRELERRGLPASVRALTPGGGVHVFLRHPGRPIATRKGVLPGMDVRGDGGFVVAAPSQHANGGRYHWDVDCHPEDAPVADCPAWLLPALEAPVEGPTHVGEVTRGAGPLGLSGAIVDGREAYMRDTVLAVCRAERDRLGRLPTEGELFEAAWPQYSRNVDFSRPGRGPEEFRAKCRYTLARAAKGAIRGFDEAPAEGGPTSEGQGGPTSETAEIRQSPLPLVYFHEAEANLDCADFVEGVLTERAMSVVYGESNAGKTFFVTDLAIHVAIGRKWRGRAIEQGGVVYCALEGRDGIMNRIAAFKAEYGADGVAVPFAVIPVPINLLDPNADRERLRDAVKVAADTMGCPVKLVVIDTLSRALAGGNENAPDDMGALVASADYIRQEVQAHVLFIHHSGKDAAKGARGHSLLRAATDTEIEVTRPEGEEVGAAKVTKQRDLPKGDEFLFRLKVVELGTNRRGKPVTSCIVEDASGATRPPPKRALRPLAPGSQVVLDALTKAMEDGKLRTLPDIPGHVRTVTEGEWRAAFHAGLPEMKPSSRTTAFARGVQDLAARKVALLRNGYAWFVKDVSV